MNLFPATPISLNRLTLNAVKNLWGTLKATWPLIVALLVIKEIYCELNLPIASNSHVHLLIMALVVLFNMGIWAVICLRSYRLLEGAALPLFEAISSVFKRSFLLLGAYFFYIFLTSLVGSIGYLIGGLLLNYLSYHEQLRPLLGLVIGLPVLYAIVLFFFAIPLILIDNLSIWKAFKEGAQLVYRRWFRGFIVYAGILLLMVLIDYIQFQPFILSYGHWLEILIQIPVFLIFIPFLSNFYMLSLHDLKLRVAEEG